MCETQHFSCLDAGGDSAPDPEICELSRGCGETHLHLEISDVFLPVRPHLLISVSSEILHTFPQGHEKIHRTSLTNQGLRYYRVFIDQNSLYVGHVVI